MKARHLLLLLAGVASAPAFAQSDGQCIVAGRLSDGQWAPRFASVQLLGANGQAIARSNRDALAGVKSARLAQPALLAECNGDKPLAMADNDPPRGKTDVPAISRGMVEVESVSFLKLRTGGELVELRVRVPQDRVVMLTR